MSPSVQAKLRFAANTLESSRRAPSMSLLKGAENEFSSRLSSAFDKDGIAILPPMEVQDCFSAIERTRMHFDTVMLDPWYNKGFGGVQDDYVEFFRAILRRSGQIADHVYFWGFPEVVALFVSSIPEPLSLTCWLTWYYKNNPSVIRGWRSSQNACLHLSRGQAILYPQRFLNEKQLKLLESKKLRYMPGPTSVLEEQPDDVIEEPLLVGFVGRKEQTGHPSQKPVRVFESLLKMTMSEHGCVFDPFAGSGTTGVAARKQGHRAVLCDRSEAYTSMMETRLNISRLKIDDLIGEDARRTVSIPL